MSFPVDLADLFASMDDLEEVKTALIREQTVRDVMAESGEDRKTVTDMIDAMDSMDQEAVLELTEGEPTTLEDALSRLSEDWHQNGVPDGAEYHLDRLLTYPWPGALDANALAQDIHEAYLRLGLAYGVEVIPWDELQSYQRDLALAVVNDLMARRVLIGRIS